MMLLNRCDPALGGSVFPRRRGYITCEVVSLSGVVDGVCSTRCAA